jgi:signal transduction histidine kinase
LIQVISNLLSDAMKFAKEREGGEGTITIIAEKKDNQGQVVVSVNDTDECIRSETLSKLFKFASNPFEGTGLGLLFIAKSIIEAHGGKIRSRIIIIILILIEKKGLPFTLLCQLSINDLM